MTFSNNRVLTGINGLDLMLGGGFPSRSIVLLCGGSGAGKTIFSLQYITSALKRGEQCVFVSFEEPVEKKYGYAKSLGWDIKKAEREGFLISLDYKLGQNLGSSLDRTGDLEYSIEHRMIEAVQKIGAKNIVVDTLTSILVQESKSNGIRHVVNQFYEAIRLLGCTALLTSEGAPNRGVFYMEHFLSDGVILLNKDTREFHLIKTIVIDKMRGIEFDDQPRRYTISEKGVEVFNTEPVIM